MKLENSMTGTSTVCTGHKVEQTTWVAAIDEDRRFMERLV